MAQSKRDSMIEVCTNVGIGFIISYMIWLYIVPLITIDTGRGGSGLVVTLVYTVASIGRGYFVRRFFDKEG